MRDHEDGDPLQRPLGEGLQTLGAPDFTVLQHDLDAYRDLRIGHATVAAAEAAQRELAASGQHRVSLPDLIIGACAQQHGADVMHVDRHFHLLAKTFGFRSIRLP